MPAGSVRFSVCPEVHPVYCIRACGFLVYYISYLDNLYVHGIVTIYPCSMYLTIGSPLGGPHSIRGVGKSATGAALNHVAKYGPLV